VTTLGQGGALPAARTFEAEQDPEDWVRALSLEGPARDLALRRLHALLVRAAYHQVLRMRPMLTASGADRVEELAHQAADEAMVAVIAKLATFEGRSRFTTWAYKFAILQAAVEVRRSAWRHREVCLAELPAATDQRPSPEQQAEAGELAAAVSAALDTALTVHQRRIAVALLIDEIPVDVLADRLGTTRGALYKTLHEARNRIRQQLVASGHLTVRTTEGVQR
jgi:RNA polymerase sigma-70 factor (ECF subfamily)